VDALLHSGPRLSEMAGGVSGVSECLDVFDQRRTLTMYFVHAVYTTNQSTYWQCVTNAILGYDTLLDYLQTPISLNLC